MNLSLIVAMDPSGTIGRGSELPWRLSTDLKRFRRLTMGHAIVMGRRTFESIGRPLPGRRTLVLTRSGMPAIEGVEQFRSVAEVLEAVRGDLQPFVVGGAEIYREFLPRVQTLYVTWVEKNVDGDVQFPAWDPHEWVEVESEEVPAGPVDEYPTRFVQYTRKPVHP